MTTNRLLVASALVLLTSTAWAAEGRSVVARIDGEPVYRDEVDRELRSALGANADLTAATPEVRQRAAEQVVDRRLVLKQLAESSQAASNQDVDFAIEQLRNELKAQGQTLAAYLKENGWVEEDFRRHLMWTLSWQQYLDTLLTDDNLRKYFDRNRPHFDGTKVRVAHLLLKADPADTTQVEQAATKARAIRERIVAGNLSFADAVRTHSQAPTAASGGDIGYIERRQPMPETFSAAAFQLKPNEISEPVVTTFGVHLIHCLEIEPGQRTWQDAAGELRPAVALYLFRWLADKRRKSSTVEWVKQ